MCSIHLQILTSDSEAPDAPYFVQSRNEVPLQSDFKPSVKLLSRKPTPTVIARKDPVSGLEKLIVEDEDDDELDAFKPKVLTMEERQAKAQKEREEKQRKYEEVRERLFGASNPPSGSNSPGSVTPPKSGRGRGKGSKDSRPSSSSGGGKGKQLYDPNYNAKPTSSYVQRQWNANSRPDEDQIIRQPKAPDGSGRGGFGFAGHQRT